MRLPVTEQSAAALLFLASQQGSVRPPLLHRTPDGNLLTHFLALLSRPERERWEELKDARAQAKAAARDLNILCMMAPVEPSGLLSMVHCLDVPSRPRKERGRKSLRRHTVKQRPQPEPSTHYAENTMTPL